MTLRRAIVAGQVAAVCYAAVDLVIASAGAWPGALSVARGAVVALGLGLPAGAALGAIVAAVAWGWRDAGAPRSATILAVPVAAAAWAALWSLFLAFAVDAFHDTSLTALATVLAGVLALGVAALVFAGARRGLSIVDRLAPARWRWTLAIVLAGGGLAVGSSRAVGLGSLSSLAAFAFAWRWPDAFARVPRRVLWLVPAGAFVAAMSPIGDDAALARSAAARGTFLPAAVGVLAPVLDWDRDGYLAVLGGGDCAEFDAARSPDGVEIADNGVDEDCRYGDMRAVVARPAPPPREPVDVVVVATVAGLDVDATGALAPALPAVERRLAAGIRFARPVGIAGRFRHVAPVIVDGRLPPSFHPGSSGLPTGGPTLPRLVEQAGGRAGFAAPKSVPLDELATQFSRSRSAANKKKPGDIAKQALGYARGKPAFVWVHLELRGKSTPAAVDAALDRMFDEIAGQSPRHAILLVGLGADAPARPDGARAPGGPIALVGTGIAAAVEQRPVGVYDVYPTVAHLLGIAPPDSRPGASLLALSERAGALTAWLDRRAVVRSVGDAPAPARSAQVRDEVLAPRRQRRNAALAAARVSTLPDGIDGTPARYADSLRILGCTHELRPDRQMTITMYMTGGEQLEPDDLLTFKVSSPHRGSMRGRVLPVDGAYPFGTWRRGEVVAHTLDIDLRPVLPGTATLWVGVLRDGAPLPVTDGLGSTPEWGRICNVEVPSR